MKPKNKMNKLFLLMTSVFSILLLAVSSAACYYAYVEKKSQILSSMDMAYSSMTQEYENIINNYWQVYMPLFSGSSSDNGIFHRYFTVAKADDLTPVDKLTLAKSLEQMSVRDNRIAWIALYSDNRADNYIKYTSDSAVKVLDAAFPYLPDMKSKTTQMEIYGARDIVTRFGTEKTFAICGGVPAGMGGGKILIGYHLNTFEKISNFQMDSVPSVRFSIWSADQLLFDSKGEYHADSIFPPSGVQKGLTPFKGDKLYVRSDYSGNNTSIIAYTASWADIFKAANKDTYWILSITFAFMFFSLLVHTGMNRSVSREVSVIRKGLKIIAGNRLDFRLPTNFKQGGLPEIARHINDMSATLDDNIKKAYYFELKQKDAQLAQLQATFNPHFLYNTLEMLRSKSYAGGDEDTAALIADLASIFRGFIGAKSFVTLKEELAFSKKYLALLSARYGDKVRITYDIESPLLNYGVIRNSFQILIENYFVHGFNTEGTDNRIRIIGKSIDESNMLLAMEDNGFGMSDSDIAALNEKIGDPIQHGNESYGLKNLNQRLKLFYGPEYGLHIQGNDDGGLTVQMKLYKMRVEDYEEQKREDGILR